jgi:hypothetical protein
MEVDDFFVKVLVVHGVRPQWCLLARPHPVWRGSGVRLVSRVGRCVAAWTALLTVLACTGALAGDRPAASPQRLSDWLLMQPSPPTLSELHWRVPAERMAQAQWRQAALDGLPVDADALRVTLNAMELTGRLALSTVDVDRLRDDPKLDPFWLWGQRPHVFSIGQAIAVLSDGGSGCRLEVNGAVSVQSIWTACGPVLSPARAPEALWVALPNMQHRKVPMTDSEEGLGSLVPPGSWVWAPSAAGMDEQASRNLVKFLATQAPPMVVVDQLASVSNGLLWERVHANSGSAARALEATSEPVPKPRSLPAAPAYPRALWSWSSTASAQWAEDVLRLTGWALRSIEQDGASVQVAFEAGAEAVAWSQGTAQLLPFLHSALGSNVKAFDITLHRQLRSVARGLFDREEWLLQQASLVPPSLRLAVETPMPLPLGYRRVPNASEDAVGQVRIAPHYWQEHASASDAALEVLSLDLDGAWVWGNGVGLSARLQVPVLTPFDAQAATQTQGLVPTKTRVGSDWLARSWRVASLVMTHTQMRSSRWTSQTYAGWLSPQRAGLGAALGYQPLNSAWGFGAEVNHLMARDSASVLNTQGGVLTSGLLSAGWRWTEQEARIYGYAGRFLGGDRGLTLGVVKHLGRGVDWSAEVTHSSSEAKPLWQMRWRIPFGAVSDQWRWGGQADIQATSNFSDAGSRLELADGVTDWSVSPRGTVR